MSFTHAPSSRHAIFWEVLALAAVFMGTAALASRVWYEAQGPYTWDSTLYWAVGRGIVNGLMPYRDLYENKPPGVFLLSALSFWLSGDPRWTFIFQVVALLAILGSVIFGTQHIQKHADHPRLTLALGTLFGLILTLYAAERSGEFQVESLGAAFACVYAAMLAVRRLEAFGRGETAVAAFCIFWAFFMKEPFAIAITACALLLIQRRQTLVRNFIVPSASAAAGFLLVLPFLGTSYITMYLKEMLGRHITGGGSPWERGLFFERIWNDLQAFNPLLGWIIALCIGVLCVRYIAVYRPRGAGIARAIGLALSLYLTVFAVGLGGPFFNHHYVFAVPVYAALFFACLQHSFFIPRANILHRIPAALAGGAIALSMFALPNLDFENRLAHIAQGSHIAQEAAQRIDEILDRCGVDQYLFLGTNGMQPFGYTKHSPLGPLFFQYDYYFTQERPDFRSSFLRSLERARIVIKANASLGELQSSTEEYLSRHFREIPWPCADDVAALPDGFTAYYRYVD